jgi:hypothetical protein
MPFHKKYVNLGWKAYVYGAIGAIGGPWGVAAGVAIAAGDEALRAQKKKAGRAEDRQRIADSAAMEAFAKSLKPPPRIADKNRKIASGTEIRRKKAQSGISRRDTILTGPSGLTGSALALNSATIARRKRLLGA